MAIQKKEIKYTSKIIKATALVSDSKLFLSAWNQIFPVGKNIENIINYNLLGKTSRAFVKNITKSFKSRFFFGDDQDAALRLLVKSDIEQKIVDRILYYYTARSDSLIYDYVVETLYPAYLKGDTVFTTNIVQKYCRKISDDGKTASPWSDTVCNRVARNLLTTLRDYHILEGKVKKTISPVYLPLESFVYIAYLINRREPGGEKILQHKDWKLFLLDSQEVERLFLEAHQFGYLNYDAAGSVIRITFKQKSLIEVVNAIIC